jgi:hypothetical protein
VRINDCVRASQMGKKLLEESVRMNEPGFFGTIQKSK